MSLLTNQHKISTNSSKVHGSSCQSFCHKFNFTKHKVAKIHHELLYMSWFVPIPNDSKQHTFIEIQECHSLHAFKSSINKTFWIVFSEYCQGWVLLIFSNGAASSNHECIYTYCFETAAVDACIWIVFAILQWILCDFCFAVTKDSIYDIFF